MQPTFPDVIYLSICRAIIRSSLQGSGLYAVQRPLQVTFKKTIGHLYAPILTFHQNRYVRHFNRVCRSCVRLGQLISKRRGSERDMSRAWRYDENQRYLRMASVCPDYGIQIPPTLGFDVTDYKIQGVTANLNQCRRSKASGRKSHNRIAPSTFNYLFFKSWITAFNFRKQR